MAIGDSTNGLTSSQDLGKISQPTRGVVPRLSTLNVAKAAQRRFQASPPAAPSPKVSDDHQVQELKKTDETIRSYQRTLTFKDLVQKYEELGTMFPKDAPPQALLKRTQSHIVPQDAKPEQAAPLTERKPSKYPDQPDPPSIELPPQSNTNYRVVRQLIPKINKRTQSSPSLPKADMPQALSDSMEKVYSFTKRVIEQLAHEYGRDQKEALEAFELMFKSKNINNPAELNSLWKEIETIIQGLEGGRTPKKEVEDKVITHFVKKFLPSFEGFGEKTKEKKKSLKSSFAKADQKKLERLGIASEGKQEAVVLQQIHRQLQDLAKELSLVHTDSRKIKEQFKSEAAKSVYNLIDSTKTGKGKVKEEDIPGLAHQIADEITKYLNSNLGPKKLLQHKAKELHIQRADLRSKMFEQLNTHNENFSLELGRLIGGNYVDILQSPRDGESVINQLIREDSTQLARSQNDFRITSAIEEEQQVMSLLLSQSLFSPTTTSQFKARDYRLHMQHFFQQNGSNLQIAPEALEGFLGLLKSEKEKDHPQIALNDFKSTKEELEKTAAQCRDIQQRLEKKEKKSADRNYSQTLIAEMVGLAKTLGLPKEDYQYLEGADNPDFYSTDLSDKLEKLSERISQEGNKLSKLSSGMETFLQQYQRDGRLEYEIAQEHREQIYSMIELFAQKLEIPADELLPLLVKFLPRTPKEPALDYPEYVFAEFGDFYNHLSKNLKIENDPKVKELVSLLRTAGQGFLLSIATTLLLATRELFGKEYRIESDKDWKDDQWKKNNFIFGENSTQVIIERVGRLNVNKDVMISQVIEMEKEHGDDQWDLKMLIAIKRTASGAEIPEESFQEVVQKFSLLADLMEIDLKIIDQR